MSKTASRDERSALFAEIETFITQEYERLRRAKIDPWALFTAGPPFRCTDFYGKEISYEGIEFEGSPRDIFWGGFIEPFLRDLVIREIDCTAKLAAERGIELRTPILEAAELLKNAVVAAYHRMRDIDQHLRGAGYPNRATPRSVTEDANRMNAYVDQIVAGRLVPQPLSNRRDPQTLNAYGYAGNNPVNKIDPTGMSQVDCFGSCGGTMYFSGNGNSFSVPFTSAQTQAVARFAAQFGSIAGTSVSVNGIAVSFATSGGGTFASYRDRDAAHSPNSVNVPPQGWTVQEMRIATVGLIALLADQSSNSSSSLHDAFSVLAAAILVDAGFEILEAIPLALVRMTAVGLVGTTAGGVLLIGAGVAIGGGMVAVGTENLIFRATGTTPISDALGVSLPIFTQPPGEGGAR